jgi:hypothetical protein
MIRAIIDNRLRRLWAILIGMSVLAVTVELITIMIHDRIHWLRDARKDANWA